MSEFPSLKSTSPRRIPLYRTYTWRQVCVASQTWNWRGCVATGNDGGEYQTLSAQGDFPFDWLDYLPPLPPHGGKCMPPSLPRPTHIAGRIFKNYSGASGGRQRPTHTSAPLSAAHPGHCRAFPIFPSLSPPNQPRGYRWSAQSSSPPPRLLRQHRFPRRHLPNRRT